MLNMYTREWGITNVNCISVSAIATNGCEISFGKI